MGVIKPTLTLTSNASSSSNDPGPMSIALSLSATDSHAVDKVLTKILDVKGVYTDGDEGGTLFDASDYTASGAAGTDGGWVYLKNIHATGHVYIGHAAASNMEGGGAAARLMTLKPEEFAFFPWDMNADISFQGNDNHTAALEAWLFIRTGTA